MQGCWGIRWRWGMLDTPADQSGQEKLRHTLAHLRRSNADLVHMNKVMRITKGIIRFVRDWIETKLAAHLFDTHTHIFRKMKINPFSTKLLAVQLFYCQHTRLVIEERNPGNCDWHWEIRVMLRRSKKLPRLSVNFSSRVNNWGRQASCRDLWRKWKHELNFFKN